MRAAVALLFGLAACGRYHFADHDGDASGTSGDSLIGDSHFDGDNVAMLDSAVDVITGLLAVYPMDDDPSQTGFLAANPSTDNGMCISPDCPIATTGHIGGAHKFDGSMTAEGAIPSLISNQPYTIAVWIFATGAGQGTFVSKAVNTTDNTNVVNLVVMNDGTIEYETSVSAGSHDFIESITMVDLRNAWHHVAATWDGTTKRLYVDGMFVDGAAAAVTTSGEVVSIGCDVDFGIHSHSFMGSIDELRVYSRALTLAEVGTLAAQ